MEFLGAGFIGGIIFLCLFALLAPILNCSKEKSWKSFVFFNNHCYISSPHGYIIVEEYEVFQRYFFIVNKIRLKFFIRVADK